MRTRPSPAVRRPWAARFARPLAVAALGALALSAGEGPLLAVRLNHPLLPGEDTNAWALSPDGKRFFYTVTQPVFDGGQVFSVPSDGRHAALSLTDPLPSGRDLLVLQVSPDGQRLVYVADQDTDDQFEIYSLASDGSQAPVKLNGPLFPSGDVFQYFRFTPDASRVVFMAEGGLYSVRTDGSQPAVQLASPTVLGLFLVAADGARVVFLKGGQLHSVSVDGSATPTQLSVAGTSVFTGFLVSPDGHDAVYRTYTFVMSNFVYRILSVPVDGSTAPVLLFGPVTEGDTDEAPIIRISPDSQRVAHRSSGVSPWVLESAPIDGSAPAVTLDDPLGPGNVGYDFRWTQGGSVVFGFTPGSGVSGIYVVPGDGSQSPQRITGPTTFPTPMKWEVTPQGRVVFVGFDGGYDLYSVPLDGSAAPLQLNPPMVLDGNVIGGNVLNTPSFRLTPRGDSLVYVADQETDEVFEGYHVPCDGSAPARKINRTPGPGGDITQFIMAFTPDSRRLIYGADQEEDQLYEFFTSTLIGNPTVGNSTPLPPGQPVHR